MKFELYKLTLIGLTAMGTLALIQAFVAATFKNVITKTTPGTVIETGHDDINFRVNRAFANTMENFPLFAIFAFLAFFLGVSPKWVNILTMIFLGARTLHMFAYYADIRLFRTLCFFGGFLSTIALSVMCILKLF